MDTKKKELLGECFRRGQAYSTGPNATFDHDFPSYADGKLIRQGIYGLKRNFVVDNNSKACLVVVWNSLERANRGL